MSNTNPRVLLVDAAEKGFLGFSWRTGASLFKKSFDLVIEAKSVDTVYDALRCYPVGGLHEVQVWGHGNPGHPLIAQRALDAKNPAWAALSGGGRVWFRSCNVMQGAVGQRFAEDFAERGIDSVGHLSKIGRMGMQSYLVGLRRFDKPWWSAKLAPDSSAPWSPRTTTALEMNLPSWAFDKDKRLTA